MYRKKSMPSLIWDRDFINKVICGDCLEVMKQMPDKCVDLVVTSPPYNMGGTNLGYQPRSTVGQKLYGEYGDTLPLIEYRHFLFKVIDLCRIKSKYVFWNMQMVTSTKDIIVDILSEYKSCLKDIFIWKKHAVAQIAKGKMATGYEFIFLFGEDGSMVFSDNNFPKNNYVPNIQTFYKKETFPSHHATFPRNLPKYLIQHFTHKESIILDPFMGVGTTAVACKELNRKFIGIEINPEYCEIARKRLLNTQESLF